MIWIQHIHAWWDFYGQWSDGQYVLLVMFLLSLSVLRSLPKTFWSKSQNAWQVRIPVLKRTMALRQLYSAESTRNALSLSTWSCSRRMWSMKATTRSAAMGLAWRPAAASSGATWRGSEHWAAFRTNSSLQAWRRRPTWSVDCNSGKNGMFRAHSTALNNSLAANSHIPSIPTNPPPPLPPLLANVAPPDEQVREDSGGG